MTFPPEKHSELQGFKERFDMEGCDQMLVFHFEDPELPMWNRGLAMKEVFEHIPCSPTNMGVYASMDCVEKYMTDMETHWDTCSFEFSGVLTTVMHT